MKNLAYTDHDISFQEMLVPSSFPTNTQMSLISPWQPILVNSHYLNHSSKHTLHCLFWQDFNHHTQSIFFSMYLSLNKPVLSHLVVFSENTHSNQGLLYPPLGPCENSCVSWLGIQFCLLLVLCYEVYFLPAGVFLSGGSVTDRETAQMVPMNPPFARRAIAG